MLLLLPVACRPTPADTADTGADTDTDAGLFNAYTGVGGY